jgi:hypothetical protein
MASYFGLEGLPTLLGGGVLGAVITLAVIRYGVAKPRLSYRGESGAAPGHKRGEGGAPPARGADEGHGHEDEDANDTPWRHDAPGSNRHDSRSGDVMTATHGGETAVMGSTGEGSKEATGTPKVADLAHLLHAVYGIQRYGTTNYLMKWHREDMRELAAHFERLAGNVRGVSDGITARGSVMARYELRNLSLRDLTLEEVVTPELFAALTAHKKETNRTRMAIVRLMEEAATGVFTLQIIRHDVCEAIRVESQHFMDWCGVRRRKRERESEGGGGDG